MTRPILDATRNCVCGKRMIQRYTGMAKMSDPPQYEWDWWCGGCGWGERGGTVRGISLDEVNFQKWKDANELL